MLPPLKAALTLLSLLQLISAAPSHLQQTLKEVTQWIRFNSGPQVNAATPLSFALLSELFIDDDDDDDNDDVLQCPRPATGLPPQGLVPTWVAGALPAGSIHSVPPIIWAPWPISA